MAQITISTECRNIFGCSIHELSDACWKVITKSNDYYGEKKGHVVSIREIDPSDEFWLGTYGVLEYEKNYAIVYRMYNKDGSPCGTTVHWNSLKGGILCHGTNAWIPFKTKIKTTPVILIEFTMGYSDERQTYERVLFGGTQPTLEEKCDLINLLMKKREIKHYTMSIYHTETRHVLYGQRDRFLPCTKFLRRLLRGKYDTKQKETKKAISLQYLGKGGLEHHYQKDVEVGVYKIVYEDKTVEYKKLPISDLNCYIQSRYIPEEQTVF